MPWLEREEELDPGWLHAICGWQSKRSLQGCVGPASGRMGPPAEVCVSPHRWSSPHRPSSRSHPTAGSASCPFLNLRILGKYGCPGTGTTSACGQVILGAGASPPCPSGPSPTSPGCFCGPTQHPLAQLSTIDRLTYPMHVQMLGPLTPTFLATFLALLCSVRN